jgi:hypothetical protein
MNNGDVASTVFFFHVILHAVEIKLPQPPYPQHFENIDQLAKIPQH